MEVSAIQRIKEVIGHYSLTQKKFCETIGIPQMTLSSLFTRGTKVSSDILESIKKSFPQISGDWLLTGEGEMILPENAIVEQPYTIPILPYYARGGVMDDYVGSVTKAECETMISPIMDAGTRYNGILPKGEWDEINNMSM